MMTFKLTWETDVGHNTRTYVAFHKEVQRHPSKEINDFDVILFKIYQGMCTLIIVPKYKDLTKLLQK